MIAAEVSNAEAIADAVTALGMFGLAAFMLWSASR